MPKYVCLVTFTEQGLKGIAATTRRAAAFNERMEKKGVHAVITLWTVGRYDLVHVFEAPDDETAAALAFSLGSFGNVRTQTLRAFTAEEMDAVIAQVDTPYDLLRQGTPQPVGKAE